jgi:hypothetical protein
MKTSILNEDNINDDYTDDENVNEEMDQINMQEEEEIENLLGNLPEVKELREYFQMLDSEIPTEEQLTDEQIINMVLSEEKEESENDDEVTPISINKAVVGLKTFIDYLKS